MTKTADAAEHTLTARPDQTYLGSRGPRGHSCCWGENEERESESESENMKGKRERERLV